jgi:hypothetical protein
LKSQKAYHNPVAFVDLFDSKFEDEIKEKRKFLNHSTMSFEIQKSTINMDVLDEYYQRRHRS